MPPANYHCCVVEIAGTGVLISGKSGSGKSSLALGLLEAFSRSGESAFLVCDDQALLQVEDGKLVAHAPKAIAGKIELRGYGIVQMDHKQSARIGLVVKLVDRKDLVRMPEESQVILQDVKLASIDVPICHEQQSVRIVRAKLNELRD
jgi:serine kinase of HPr protein (carbohydrate metabolism regulator)